MQLETNEFSLFIEFLKSNGVLSVDEVDDALAFLDGVYGIVSEGTYILGYEALARCIGKKLSFGEQKAFSEAHMEELATDVDARYFFAQSLVDNPILQQDERIELIGLMPSNYQPYLLKRFSR